MNTAPHQYVGELLHDRIVGALELCCRRGEMLLIQNKRVNWDTHQIGIPGATAKDKENRRIPFNPNGRLAAILKRRAALGPEAYVFGATHGALGSAHQYTLQRRGHRLRPEGSDRLDVHPVFPRRQAVSPVNSLSPALAAMGQKPWLTEASRQVHLDEGLEAMGNG